MCAGKDRFVDSNSHPSRLAPVVPTYEHVWHLFELSLWKFCSHSDPSGPLPHSVLATQPLGSPCWLGVALSLWLGGSSWLPGGGSDC